jgi:signal transduction histidine kinase
MTLASRIDRARMLIGGPGALSNPVIAGFGALGLALNLRYSNIDVDYPWPQALAAAAGSLVVSCGFLLVMRRIAVGIGWQRPRPGLVVASVLAASVMRFIVRLAIISGPPAVFSVSLESIGRMAAAGGLLLAVSIGLAAAVQLGRERGELMAVLLAEQARLLDLAATMEQDILRAQTELRVKAIRLLEPTISDIRRMLDVELEPGEGARISARIQHSVNDVVRPVSRELAVSPSVALGGIQPLKPARLKMLTDRMDVPRAIRPGWVFILTWIAIAPAVVLVGLPLDAFLVAIVAGLVFVGVLEAVRLGWPRSLRSMRIATGMAALFVLYLLGNLAYQFALTRSGVFNDGPAPWVALSGSGLLIRVALAMIVAVLAMLDEHGQRNRAALVALNVELEELVARLRRETWLLHRSVALAVHGPVQSALVSTAMRLAAADRTQASIDDAKRRLDEALSAIEHDRYEDVSIDDALGDLRDLWRGVVRIDYAIDPGARALLAADPGLRRCMIEVCRESASNAIRHGGAGEVVITMNGEAGRVEVRVRDDGQGVAPGTVAGLGSSMLDDTCLRWELGDVAGGGAELVATLV